MAAAAARAVRVPPEPVYLLPSVKSSPTTSQYEKHKLREKPFYKPAFSMSKEVWMKTLLAPWFRTDPLMPPYPYGKNHPFPEANYGLYGGATLGTGNKISKGRNKGKTIRKWFPNIRVETIRSEALDRELTIPIRARVMRTIRKLGGLDQYVLGDRPARIKQLGLLGWKLRWMVMNSPAMREKYAKERLKLGLPEKYSAIETFEDAWNDPERQKIMIEEQDQAWEKIREKVADYHSHVKRQWDTRDEKVLALQESYTHEKDRKTFTILNTEPSGLKLPTRLQEMPYNVYQNLPKEIQEGKRTLEDMSLLRRASEADLEAVERDEMSEDDLLHKLRESQQQRRPHGVRKEAKGRKADGTEKRREQRKQATVDS